MTGEATPLLAATEAAAGATSAAAVATAAVFLPIVATGEAIYATDRIDRTERTYGKVDRLFRSDGKLFSNLLSAEHELSGRLNELSITKDTEGKIEWADPANIAKFKEAVAEKKAQYDQTIRANATHMPRWMQWTSAQAQKRYNIESAMLGSRVMDSALTELNEYAGELDRQREKAAISARNQADGQHIPGKPSKLTHFDGEAGSLRPPTPLDAPLRPVHTR